ncbi:hypothetical protein AXG93_1864s1330 [Marchantia polymorpha subsp. ruderalis]|nr:hypothetical protein AXG93_1864s1330 [Marchantia polymorpha subsp. ruderalis]
MVHKGKSSRSCSCKGRGKAERSILRGGAGGAGTGAGGGGRKGGMDYQKDFWEEFDIIATASFIVRNGFQRVALQFPDELLKHSVAVAVALKKELGKQRNSRFSEEPENAAVRLFVMADTTFGSCCADEVAAMHADAQCIVHYGNACLSLTSRLPVWFVFGRAALDVEDCTSQIVDYASAVSKPLLVMFGLEYSHEVTSIKQRLSTIQERQLNVTFADVPSQHMKPSSSIEKRKKGGRRAEDEDKSDEIGMVDDQSVDKKSSTCSAVDSNLRETSLCTEAELLASGGQGINSERTTSDFEASHYSLGGLKWTLPKDTTMGDYDILWIGGDCPGLTNAALVFNTSPVVRYDCFEQKLVRDVANQSRVLKRRYYLVERAKDANVVGIVVGTLGVAGYADAIQNMRRIIESSGKKAYTLVMGKPNPAKLANFPECDVFVLVACPQTALIDSKDYLAPLLTPFEAELAFVEGKQWTGAYRLDFDHDPGYQGTSDNAPQPRSDEARYSFFAGGYVGRGSSETKDVEDATSRAIVLSKSAEHALQLQSNPSSSLITTERSRLDIKSGAEYLASRSYQGLDVNDGGDQALNKDLSAVPGRKGRAACYSDEATN